MYRAFQFKHKIDNIFEITKGVSDDETKAALSKYLCVLVSGYLELNLREIILEYADTKSSPTIQNFIEFSIQGITNLKSGKIVESLNKFNSEWGKQFEAVISDEQKDAINAIVANRNNIAHGKDVGISFVRIKGYYERTQEVVKLIEGIVK